MLVEREWLEFGHKFADRCGHSSDKIPHEISPVFFQWLDAVFQIVRQFPSAFEFNESFLVSNCFAYLVYMYISKRVISERRIIVVGF